MSTNKASSSSGASKTSAPKRPATQPSSGTGTGKAGTSKPSSGRPTLVKPAAKGKARRARLQISKLDSWSVLKLAFLLSVALGIVTVVAAVAVWGILDLTGVFHKANSLLNVTQEPGDENKVDVKNILSLGQVASFATILAVVNVVLLTALSVVASLLYNISATLVGGIGVTLTDE